MQTDFKTYSIHCHGYLQNMFNQEAAQDLISDGKHTLLKKLTVCDRREIATDRRRKLKVYRSKGQRR